MMLKRGKSSHENSAVWGLTHLEAVQGSSEARNEAYPRYGE